MLHRRAFLGFGANEADRGARLAETLAALERVGLGVAACARPVLSPYEDDDGTVREAVRPVLNTVIEVDAADHVADALLRVLRALEDDAGRERHRPESRTLDLDLLAMGDLVLDDDVVLPHPRALERAFVLGPWAEIAPCYVVPGTAAPVVAHVAALAAERPGAFAALDAQPLPAFPALGGTCERLEDRAALGRWRCAQNGTVGVVPTMGALHAGHLALVRRARAACDRVLATIFVNPLQFGPGEDLARYPRTLEADLAALMDAGVDAVYLPAPDDLYPAGYGTYVVPEGPAAGFESVARPGHFRGVATVVLKLLLRTRPDMAFFGQKDAQQFAVVERMVADLDLPIRIVACPTVRDTDGLALSSRNRYLAPDGRVRGLALARALSAMAGAAAAGERTHGAIVGAGRAVLDATDGIAVEYLDLVDAATFAPVDALTSVALGIGTIRIGDTRLLDNRWVAAPA